MWRWNAMVVVWASLLGCVSSAGAADADSSLILQSGWTRFEIVLGRLTAIHLRGGQNHCVKEPASPGAPRETVSVNGDAASPAFRYEQLSADRSLTVEIVELGQVEILRRQQTPSGEVTLHLVQPARGLLELTLTRGDCSETYTAASIWHLLLAQPQLARSHVVPILSTLRSDWNLMQRAEKIEAALFASANEQTLISMTELKLAVAELNSRRFAQRQAADRRIRSYGVSVLPYLAELDTAALSVEQRMRLQRIRAGLSSSTPDSAERVAVWLSSDKAIWVSFLSHSESSKREMAARRLADMHRGVVQFDPFADESQRRKQITQLRSRLGMAAY